MDEELRLQYLKAMGIQVWVPRERSLAPKFSTRIETTVPGDTGSESDAALAWEKLEAEVVVCTKCRLCETRTKTVFGSGNRSADWMVIGEGPGQHEDEQGKPFVGRAGQLLTEMLRATGLERDEVFITNIVKCRPPNNRDPKPDEVLSCHNYLQRQMALIKPKIILAIGRISAQTLLKTEAPISRLRSKVHMLDEIPLVVVYHPAYLLRSLLEKRKAWQDLQLAMRTVGNINDQDARAHRQN